MLVRTQDLDPQTLNAVMDSLGKAVRSPDPSPELRSLLTEDSRRFRPDWRKFLPWALAGLLVPIALLASVPLGVSASFAYPAAWVAFFAGFGIGIARLVTDYVRRAKVVHSDLLAGSLPHIELTPLDRAYCEVLVWLAKPGLRVDEETARSVLGELNRLAGHFRKLEGQKAELASLSNALSHEKAVAELDRLTKQLASTEDPEARRSIEDSVELCRQRVESTLQIEPVAERLQAQQELILQTLASIQANLARLAQADQLLTETDVAAIREQSENIQSHAEAVETAVDEVVSLRQE
jgi:hypothetical protein